MIIFNFEGRINTADDKTNIIHKFNVPENIKALKITYKYSPKLLDGKHAARQAVRDCFDKYGEVLKGDYDNYLPVKNLVTISVDACGRYIGAAHRQANEQEHIIGPDFSSYGFEKTKIISGEWDIVLNVHSVSTQVCYSVLVEGEAE